MAAGSTGPPTRLRKPSSAAALLVRQVRVRLRTMVAWVAVEVGQGAALSNERPLLPLLTHPLLTHPLPADDALVRQLPAYYQVSDPNADGPQGGGGAPPRQFVNGEGGQDVRAVKNRARPQYYPDDTSDAGAVFRRRMWEALSDSERNIAQQHPNIGYPVVQFTNGRVKIILPVMFRKTVSSSRCSQHYVIRCYSRVRSNLA